MVKEEELLQLEGIKEKSASKIVNNIQKVISKPIELEKLVSGSCILGDGIGEKILVKIFHHFQIKSQNDLEKINLLELKDIEGIEEKTAKKIMKGVPKIKDFLIEHPFLKFKPYSSSSTKSKKGKLFNQSIVMTGKRDNMVIKFIEKEGGEIKSAVNKNTNLLLVDTMDTSSSKMEKAKKLNIPVLTNMDFKKQYSL